MTVHEAAPPQTATPRTLPDWRLALFSRMWAVAALFHLLGNARDALTTSPGLAVSSVLLAAAAAVALLRPYRIWALGLLSSLIPVTAWYEAPMVGNHWVLATLISLAVLLGMVATRLHGRPDHLWAAVAPTARATLLAAYAFAAFAKLNSDFLDPAVSCAIYYHNQLAQSWGLDLLRLSGSFPLSVAVPVSAAAIELTVAATLAVSRTRRFGLVLAGGFHWLLAMDLGQHFWDFSAVLFACFILFLDDAQAARLRRWTEGLRSRALVRPQIWPLAAGTAVALVAGLNVLPLPSGLDAFRLLLGHLTWWTYGTAVVMCLALLACGSRGPKASAEASLRPPAALLCVVPALAVLNGLTPYLEIKTGFGWNMYSNLRTVAGDSNHLLVPSTVDTTGVQADQVRILDSSDPALARLVGSGYVLAFKEFQVYAQGHPDVSVAYERDGRRHVVRRLGDDPAARGDVGTVSQRLQPFRLIDVSGSERCRPGFELAR